MSESKKRQGPTREQYIECAQVGHEYNEIIALGDLAPLLEAEHDHAYLCQLGIWYWQCGHKTLASACYRRSLELHPEAPTYFNLAICLDDMASELSGEHERSGHAQPEYLKEAVQALKSFYKLVPTLEERASAEEMLKQNGKAHLIRDAGGK